MLTKPWAIAMLAMQVATLTALLSSCSGCIGMQATRTIDSTKGIEALTAGERNVTYTMVPGDLLAGNNALNPLSGKVVFIPTVPGKDVEFHAFYPDGQPYLTLTTKRSAVTDAILGQIAGIDGAKLAADMAQREFYAAQMDKLIAIVQPFLNQALVQMQTTTPTTSMRQRADSWLEFTSDPRFIALIQQVARSGHPTTQPSPQ